MNKLLVSTFGLTILFIILPNNELKVEGSEYFVAIDKNLILDYKTSDESINPNIELISGCNKAPDSKAEAEWMKKNCR